MKTRYERAEAIKNYREKQNGRFRVGDRVRYKKVGAFDRSNKEYTGVITSIEGDEIYVQRDGTSEVDWKTPVELTKV